MHGADGWRRAHVAAPPVIVVLLAVAVLLTACSSTTDEASSEPRTSATTLPVGPPPGTPPPSLVAPPRSDTPTFTGDAEEVEQAFRARLDALERQDVDAALALTRQPPPSLREELEHFTRTYAVRLYRINDISVDGDEAVIEYEDAIVGRTLQDGVTTLLAQRDRWTREDGAWKFIVNTSSTPGIPEDLAAVTVTLTEDGTVVPPDPMPTGDFAFLIENDGDDERSVFLLSLPPTYDLARLADTVVDVSDRRQRDAVAPYPDGIGELGATPEVPPLDTGTMVFSDQLPPGRYALVSAPATDDGSIERPTFAEFTID